MPQAAQNDRVARIVGQFTDAMDSLEDAKPFAKANYQNQVLQLALRLLKQPGGVEALYGLAGRFDEAGVFYGGDWDHPSRLQADFVSQSLRNRGLSLAIECLSELRMLAIVEGEARHAEVSPDEAQRFLEDVLAHNLDLLHAESSEASRAAAGPLMDGVSRLFQFIADTLGSEGILTSIVDEAERILDQRPILVGRVKAILRTASRTLAKEGASAFHQRADRLIAAMEGPTELSRSVGIDGYGDALERLSGEQLRVEAETFGDSMWVSGLVCPQHAVLLRYINEHHPEELSRALGLGAIGRTVLNAREPLVRRLIDVAIHPATAQSIYGLACMLTCGILFFPPVPPGLRRLIGLKVRPEVGAALHEVVEGGEGLSPNALLLAGALSIVGQPLGVGQGDNPTCQSARAISLWAQSDAGYLLELIAQAARDDEIIMHFEGQPLVSSALPPGMAEDLHTELDPVSRVLVPHLDRVYAEMSRRVVGRGEDGHKWINPEFHGWWVQRGFAIAVRVATGAVAEFDAFIRLFYATYHPHYRDEAELIYSQPAGVAATDLWGGFLGWHAISIQRVEPDLEGEMRVYFYNPNNDGGQRWGQGLVTSTSGRGELAGESSLPFHEFAARLYLFHYNPREHGDPAAVPDQAVRRIATLARESWASHMPWSNAPGGVAAAYTAPFR